MVLLRSPSLARTLLLPCWSSGVTLGERNTPLGVGILPARITIGGLPVCANTLIDYDDYDY
jgi:hypothetical protein